MVLFSLNFKVLEVDPRSFAVTLTHILWSGGSPGVGVPGVVQPALCHRWQSVTPGAPGCWNIRGRAQAVLVAAAALQGQQPLPARGELVGEEEPPPAAAAQAAQPR